MGDRMLQLVEGSVRVHISQGSNRAPEYAEVGRTGSGRGIQHSKTLKVDKYLLAGSFNWTTSSTSNVECNTLTWLNVNGELSYEVWRKKLDAASDVFTQNLQERAAKVRTTRGRSQERNLGKFAKSNNYSILRARSEDIKRKQILSGVKSGTTDTECEADAWKG